MLGECAGFCDTRRSLELIQHRRRSLNDELTFSSPVLKSIQGRVKLFLVDAVGVNRDALNLVLRAAPRTDHQRPAAVATRIETSLVFPSALYAFRHMTIGASLNRLTSALQARRLRTFRAAVSCKRWLASLSARVIADRQSEKGRSSGCGECRDHRLRSRCNQGDI